ncbi:polysaccharide deacetylase family protein [Marinilabilia rubra]|uniref:Chitooligosaccharide deacetylase n=1 Tax=Marinilabilia rubra TaxID=2162893 RepID=A0A2U2BBR7_9BACT|nr:polysaccharide deacetylase family protein [Marinilabilia rubra]PWE00473.1 chitooligosaccharide deacetylase [Marinilabilia rubra]
MKSLLLTIVLISFSFLSPMGVTAQESEKVWNGHKCAVVLTYDDALNVHLDNVVPALDAADINGTFYVPCNALPLIERMDEWREIARNGHELGNHTIFHPCDGSLAGREWVSADQDLSTYSFFRLMEEIRVGNAMLKAIDGKEHRTFAYTCGDKSVEDSSFVEAISKWFPAARDVMFRIEHQDEVNPMEVGSFFVMNNTGEELIAQVEKARMEGGLLVFLFHGVGGEHALNVSLEAHNKLVEYLQTNKEYIWVAPLVEVADYF